MVHKKGIHVDIRHVEPGIMLQSWQEPVVFPGSEAIHGDGVWDTAEVDIVEPHLFQCFPLGKQFNLN